ncbi:MAG: hypothetical protein CVV27_01275 [Candidatus Melainabacteria bacterium HGW-Melainabacteria-1]|nr:MAG: hypothetical protein CVV27_01275 [Candidatus Melainabacteria bacterium HGW-Melainabacteria-1]
MNVSKLVSPINMPQAQAASPYTPYLQSADPSQPANPFNSHVDGFVTRTLFGGISGKNMAQLLFADGAPGTQGLDAITQNAFVKQTALSVGMGAGLYAGLSVLKQGWGMAVGKQDARGAAANILTDGMRGSFTGLGAAAGGGLTGLAMRVMGATGLFGTVMSFIGGAVGGTIGGSLLESTGVRDKLVSAFGSSKATPAPVPAT